MGFRQSSDLLKNNPSLSTSYSGAGKIMGGKLTLTDAAISQGAGIVLQSLQIIEKGTNKNALSIILFDADLVGTYTNDAALTIHNSDVSKIVGRFSVVASDYVTHGGVSIAVVNISPTVIKLSTGKALYALIIADGAITLASASDLHMRLGVLQD